MSDINVEELRKPGVFSLDKLLANTAYPEETVRLFTNAYAVNELIKLASDAKDIETRIAEINKNSRTERTVGTIEEPVDGSEKSSLNKQLLDVQERIEKLEAAVQESAIVFKLRGIPPYVVDEITKKHFTDSKKDYSGTPEEEARDNELIVKTVIAVEDSLGNVDQSPFTEERLAALRGAVLANEYIRLVKAVAHVNLNGALFEQATDASFLSRRVDVAG